MATGYGQQPYGTSPYGGSITAADLPYGTLPSSSAVVGFATVGASVVDQDLGSVTMGRQDVTIRGVGRTNVPAGAVPGVTRMTAPTVTTAASNLMAQPSTTLPVVHYNTQLYQPGDTSIMQGFNRLTQASQVTFDPGTYEFSNFSVASNTYGVYHQYLYGIFGLTPVPTDTVFQMVPNSSTVPSPSTGSNSLALIRLGQSASPPSFCGNFHLNGTPQSATAAYNGLEIYKGGPGTQVSNLYIQGWKGYSNIPPGETYGLGLFQCIGTSANQVQVRDIDANGINSLGQLVGTSPIGWASSSWVNSVNTNCHDTISGMPTFWQATDITCTNLTSQRCGSGTGSLSANAINCEESTRLTFLQPKIYADHPPSNAGLYPHVSVASGFFDCEVTIRDATWDHPAYGNTTQLLVMIPTNYPPPQQNEKVTGNLVKQYDAAGNQLTYKVYH